MKLSLTHQFLLLVTVRSTSSAIIAKRGAFDRCVSNLVSGKAHQAASCTRVMDEQVKLVAPLPTASDTPIVLYGFRWVILAM